VIITAGAPGEQLCWSEPRMGFSARNVNRVKMIKRQMYGRVNPDLLRKRLLLAD
jgi:hypothetical protein